MQADFLDYYRNNLNFLRQASEDFARAYPKIAASLALSNFECADPFVERLLEGTAFLTAKVEAHLDTGYARFLQQVVAQVAPMLNIPLPALACVQLTPRQLGQLPYVASGQTFALPALKGRKCTFSALWPLQFTPFAFSNWSYHQGVSAELPQWAELELGIKAKSVLTCDINLTVPLSALHSWYELNPSASSVLELFLNLPESAASSFYQLLCQEQLAVYVRGVDARGASVLHQLKPLEVQAALYAQPSYLQQVVGGAAALDYLALYLHYPALCKFIRLTNLVEQWLKLNLTSGRLIVVCQRDLTAQLSLGTESVLTAVLPLINVFAQRSNRSALTLRSDYQVQIDRTHPRDYEVLTVKEIECYDQQQRLRFRAFPMTGVRPILPVAAPSSEDSEAAAELELGSDEVSFSCERRVPLVSANPRSLYRLSHMFVAFTGSAYIQAVTGALAALEPQLQEGAVPRDLGLDIVAQCYCSNGDLPYFLLANAEVRSSNDLVSGTILGDVTKMSPARLTSAATDDLTLLSFALMNTTALLRQPEAEIVAYLRALIVACGEHSSEVEQLAQCVVGFSREHMTFRQFKQGVVFFEEGVRLTLTLDESLLGGSGIRFVAELLAQVLMSSLALNAHAQLHVRSTTNEEVGVWTH